jgi:nucleoid-associated protein YgaU
MSFENLRHYFKHIIGQDKVEVVKGDSLRGIAKHVTGDESRWTELSTANPDRNFSDHNTIIHPGEFINLPDGWPIHLCQSSEE